MKLTKNLRNAFVRAAMNDVPQIDYDEQYRALGMNAAIAAMPADVLALYKKRPEYFALNQHKLGDDTNYRFYEHVYVPMPEEQSFPAHVNEEMVRILTLQSAQAEARTLLRQKIEAAAASVTTRKALAELLPEFEKYLPADDRTATLNLPAVANIMADFIKAGWPKGQVAI